MVVFDDPHNLAIFDFENELRGYSTVADHGYLPSILELLLKIANRFCVSYAQHVRIIFANEFRFTACTNAQFIIREHTTITAFYYLT